jgi:hypothetical protein
LITSSAAAAISLFASPGRSFIRIINGSTISFHPPVFA